MAPRPCYIAAPSACLLGVLMVWLDIPDNIRSVTTQLEAQRMARMFQNCSSFYKIVYGLGVFERWFPDARCPSRSILYFDEAPPKKEHHWSANPVSDMHFVLACRLSHPRDRSLARLARVARVQVASLAACLARNEPRFTHADQASHS